MVEKFGVRMNGIHVEYPVKTETLNSHRKFICSRQNLKYFSLSLSIFP